MRTKKLDVGCVSRSYQELAATDTCEELMRYWKQEHLEERPEHYRSYGSEQIDKVSFEMCIRDSLRRFKRQCARAGVLQEVRKREHYEKPSVKRKKKSEAARKRKFKKR